MKIKTNGNGEHHTPLPEVRIDIGSGFDAGIGKMTAEAVKASGAKVANDLLEVASQARRTADGIEEEATRIAQAINDATEGLADRIASYVDSCKAAADSFKEHQQTLVNLLTLPEIVDNKKVSTLQADIEQALAERIEQIK